MIFIAISVIVIAFLALAGFILAVHDRIAFARRHPEAAAVNLMGWVGFMAVVPWLQAFMRP